MKRRDAVLGSFILVVYLKVIHSQNEICCNSFLNIVPQKNVLEELSFPIQFIEALIFRDGGN